MAGWSSDSRRLWTPGYKQGRPRDSAEGRWALEEKAVLGGTGGGEDSGGGGVSGVSNPCRKAHSF